MGATGRAPGRTIDVGKPNESNRTRGICALSENKTERIRREEREEERMIEAGREKCCSLL
jgi:hypothetical protein